MPFREIGGLLLLLVAVFLLGMLWFRLVEAVLGWLWKRLTRRRKPPALPRAGGRRAGLRARA